MTGAPSRSSRSKYFTGSYTLIPQFPPTAVVTPIRSMASKIQNWILSSFTGSSCIWMSINPGATTFPAASITRSASSSSSVTATIFPSSKSRFRWVCTRLAGSTTRPFLISVFILFTLSLSYSIASAVS